MQRCVVLLAALAIVLDGFDGQLIGFAIPVLIREWGITRGAFAPAVAAGWSGWASAVRARESSRTASAAARP